MNTNSPIENWYKEECDTHQQSQSVWSNYTSTTTKPNLSHTQNVTNPTKLDKRRYFQKGEEKENDVLIVDCDENWDEEKVTSPVKRSELFPTNEELDIATNDVTWNDQYVEYAQNLANSDNETILYRTDVQSRPIVECDENWDEKEVTPPEQSSDFFSTNKGLDTATNDVTWNVQNVEYGRNRNVSLNANNETILRRTKESRFFQMDELKENDVKSRPIVECDENWDDEEVASVPKAVTSQVLDNVTNHVDWNNDNVEYVKNCKVPGKRKLNDVFDINGDNDVESLVFSDGYDENLFGDVNDRDWLNRMSEMERETVLFQRSEARESLRDQWQVRHKLNTHKLTNQVTSDCMTNQRKECFQQRQAQLAQNCVENPRRYAMTELIDRRSKRIDKRYKFEDNNDANNSRGCHGQELSGYVGTLKQINQLRLARFKLERIVYWPMFEKTVLNCFVRVCIGNDPLMRPVYRIAEIVGFVERVRPYKLGTSITNVALRLKHGAQHHNFNMQVISNQPFTQKEFSIWQRSCIEEDVDMPSLSLIAQKQKLVNAALDYVPSEEVIQRMIEKKNSLRQKPVNITVHKACLLKERDAAIKAGEFDTANALNVEISEINDDGDDSTNRINSCPLNFINERNRQLNINAVDTKVENSQQSDPFTRRMTQPRLLSNSQDKCNNKTVEMQRTTLKIRTPIKNQLPTFTTSGADLYDLHNFDIDLDLTTTIKKQ